MKVCRISNAMNMEFNIIKLNTIRKILNENKSIDFTKNPQNAIVYLNNCSAIYTDKNNKKIHAKSGNAIYLPQGIEYSVTYYNSDIEKSYIDFIKFTLVDPWGDEFVISNDIEVIILTKIQEQLTTKLIEKDNSLSLLKKRALMFEILDSLEAPQLNIDNLIYPGYSYISEHFCENIPISDFAKLCNISESYFRKRFRSCLGVSPTEYIKRLRIEKAREYLVYDDISIQEISDIIGYDTASHFIKEFKKVYSMSPLKYRKQHAIGKTSKE